MVGIERLVGSKAITSHDRGEAVFKEIEARRPSTSADMYPTARKDGGRILQPAANGNF